MNKFSKIAMAAVLATMGGAALAANTATLEVKGKITPTGCSVNLSGTENLAFNIHTNELLEDANHMPNAKEFQLAIVCAGDSMIYWTLADNKASSKAEDSGGKFGLGNIGDVQIGSYNLIRKPGKQAATKADGTSVSGVKIAFKQNTPPTGNDVSVWGLDLSITPDVDYMGYSTGSGANQPLISAQSYTETLTVQPYFNKKSAFDGIVQQADIAGNATIVVTQL